MKHQLPCPTCGRGLQVLFGTDGNGHHTERWPAHACVAPEPVQVAPPPPKRGVNLEACTVCGERPIVGDIEQGAKYCDPCRRAVLKAQVAAWRERNRPAVEAKRRARRSALRQKPGNTCACGRDCGKAERCLVCIAAEMLEAKRQRSERQREVA